jgi:hypothetical protein
LAWKTSNVENIEHERKHKTKKEKKKLLIDVGMDTL